MNNQLRRKKMETRSMTLCQIWMKRKQTPMTLLTMTARLFT